MYTKAEMLAIVEAEGAFETFDIGVKFPEDTEETIYKCYINRHRSDVYIGGWCGYVCIDKDHPLFGKTEGFPECHGGVTYYEMGLKWPRKYKLDTTGMWVIGFDCAHSWDIVPDQILRESDVHRGIFMPYQQYRTKHYVKQEVANLAHVLHKLSNPLKYATEPDELEHP